MRRFVGLIVAAAMLGSFPSIVTAADDGLSLYTGKGTLEVTEDPTDSGRGNVFSIDGFDCSRGTDEAKGTNPYIELPSSLLYNESDGQYTMKDEWTFSFDWYGMAQGYRYAFYTGTVKPYGSNMTGIYYFPDSGSSTVVEGVTGDNRAFTASGEYVSTKKEWHNFKLEWKNNTISLYKDGVKYIEKDGSGYTYASSEEPVIRMGYSPYISDPGAYAYIDNIVVADASGELLNDTADSQYGEIGDVPPDPDPVTVYTDVSDGSETQKLIDNRPDIQRRAENLDRGLVAAKTDAYGFISWRWLGTESAATKYNVYKNGEKLTSEPINKTSYIDYAAKAGDSYTVTAVTNGTEGEQSKSATLLDEDYVNIPLDKPAGGKVTLSDGTEQEYTYTSNDASTADLDGDGELEIILKWDPTNSRDSAQVGPTGNTYFDAYKLDGTRLWRIDLGVNIRSGAHDTQVLCADFNNDGKAEVAIRTADGTVAGDGTVIGDGTKDWRNSNGKNLTGPLYLTVFNGETGAVIDTVDYYPQTIGESNGITWDSSSWGDDWGNRSERYNACVFYEDGNIPSMMFARGYYDRTVLAAFSMKDNKIVTDWIFDTALMSETEAAQYKSKGNHSVCVADVDYDGKDEIIYGAITFDDNGKPLYTSDKLAHGDAQHIGDFIPDRPGLEIFSVHESGSYGQDMKDARTGEILWSSPKTSLDVGRGVSDDIDPTRAGAESWSSIGLLLDENGDIISDNYSIPANFLVYWDGDLGREIQDSVNISKYNPYTYKVETIFSAGECHSNNSSKATSSLTADILGDWREEVIYPTLDDSALRIYTTTIPTSYKIPALMTDNEYRDAVAVQNVGYNQPTHVGYNLSYTTETVPIPQIYTVDANGSDVRNPDLANGSTWNLSDLYDGETIELAIGSPKALINGAPYYIDTDDTSLAPYISNDRTMVPLRFVSEALGAYVTWDGDTSTANIYSDKGTISITLGSASCVVNSETKEMDAVSEMKSDRIFVPWRFVAEELGLTVDWADNGVVTISDKSIESDAESVLATLQSVSALRPTGEAGLVNGEKMISTQADTLEVYASEGDGSAACDLDYDTTWKSNGHGVILIRGDENPISAVVVKFADGKRHKFKVFTRTAIPVGDVEDLSNRDGWNIVVDSECDGNNDAETFIFSVPKYHDSIKLELLDDTPCEIAEIGIVGVQ